MSMTRLLIIFVCVLLILTYSIWHMGGELARLEETQKQAAQTIETLKKDQAHAQTILKEWAEERATLDEMRREVEHAVKEAIRNDPTYANWRGQALPDSFIPFSGGLRLQSPGPLPTP